MSETTVVLVTGAPGFIAKHCIAELLRQGYSVRGTVREPPRSGDAVRRAMHNAGVDAAGLTVVAADLERDDGWDAAVDGCSHVLHVASPFPIQQPPDREAIIRPARDGTLRVLRAAPASHATKPPSRYTEAGLVQTRSRRHHIGREHVHDAVHFTVAVDVDARGADASEHLGECTGSVVFERHSQV